MKPAVTAKNIVKFYGTKNNKIQARRSISFEVGKGELFGIIGPDGAGKTSLFRILTTLLLADEGEATIDSFDVVKDYKEIRKRVGYSLPDFFIIFHHIKTIYCCFAFISK